MNPSSPKPFIAIACGGTGGHLFPGIAVAQELRRRGADVALLISPKEVDQLAVKKANGLEVVTLPAVAFQGGSRLASLRGLWQSWRASLAFFRARQPQAVLAMGGFTSVAPVFAARFLGAKTFLHESNTIPGRANRWLAPWVTHAFVGFPQAAGRLRARQISVTGTPVRPQFTAGGTAPHDAGHPLVLVMGGSQGAGGLNDLILGMLPLAASHAPHWRWLHLTGPADFDRVRSGYASHGLSAVVHPFLAEMDQALASATVTVSRAGASSLAEIAAVRLPSVLVPYPAAADNHQFHNARAFVDSAAARMAEQQQATPASVFEILKTLVEDRATRARMQAALGRWHTPGAAGDIAEMILKAMNANATCGVPCASDPPATAHRQVRGAVGFGVWGLAVGGSLTLANWSLFCL